MRCSYLNRPRTTDASFELVGRPKADIALVSLGRESSTAHTNDAVGLEFLFDPSIDVGEPYDRIKAVVVADRSARHETGFRDRYPPHP